MDFKTGIYGELGDLAAFAAGPRWPDLSMSLQAFGDYGDIGDFVSAIPPGLMGHPSPKYPLSSVQKFEVRSDTVHLYKA
jgi:hypothetical protein